MKPDNGKNQRPLLSGPAEQSARAVTNFAKLELELDDLSVLRRRGDNQQLAKHRAALRARWDAADRPATADETATQLILLSAAFPNTARADLDLFAQVLADDVATLKPTGYELAYACRAVRAEHDFLSVAAVIKAIKQARRAGRRARWLVTGSFHRDDRSVLSSDEDYFQMLEILTEEGNGTKAEREILRQEFVEGRMTTRTTMYDGSVKHRMQWLEAVASDKRMRGLPSACAILLATRYVNSQHGMAWPSSDRLASELHTDRRNCRRALDRLVDAGWIGRSLGGGRGRSNRYHLKGGTCARFPVLKKGACMTETGALVTQ